MSSINDIKDLYTQIKVSETKGTLLSEASFDIGPGHKDAQKTQKLYNKGSRTDNPHEKEQFLKRTGPQLPLAKGKSGMQVASYELEGDLLGEKEDSPYEKASDAALDSRYGYGRASGDKRSFGRAANRASAAAMLRRLRRDRDEGRETSREAGADAVHQGWAHTARTSKDQTPEKKERRAKLADTPYSKLPEDEKEKDRVSADAVRAVYKGRKNKINSNYELEGDQLDEIVGPLLRIGLAAGGGALASKGIQHLQKKANQAIDSARKTTKIGGDNRVPQMNSYEVEGNDVSEENEKSERTGMSRKQTYDMLKGHKYTREDLWGMQKKATKEGDHGMAAGIYDRWKEMNEEIIMIEREMTTDEMKKEKKLKDKYDDSDMKKNMIDKYGEEKGTQIYFATIRKQAMKKSSDKNEEFDMQEEFYAYVIESLVQLEYAEDEDAAETMFEHLSDEILATFAETYLEEGGLFPNYHDYVGPYDKKDIKIKNTMKKKGAEYKNNSSLRAKYKKSLDDSDENSPSFNSKGEFVRRKKKTQNEEYIEEKAQGTRKKSTAHVYDMDETLFGHDHSKVRVHVNDSSGKRVHSLSNQEFNTHKLPKGHSYDFSEFRSSEVFKKSAKPLKKMIKHLKRQQSRGYDTHIVTARSDMDDKKHFAKHLSKYGIDITPNKKGSHTHVHRSGNEEGSDVGLKKQKVLSRLADRHGYKKVHMYDDAEKVHQATHEKTPGTTVKGHMVKPNKQGEVTSRPYKPTKPGTGRNNRNEEMTAYEYWKQFINEDIKSFSDKGGAVGSLTRAISRSGTDAGKAQNRAAIGKVVSGINRAATKTMQTGGLAGAADRGIKSFQTSARQNLGLEKKPAGPEKAKPNASMPADSARGGDAAFRAGGGNAALKPGMNRQQVQAAGMAAIRSKPKVGNIPSQEGTGKGSPTDKPVSKVIDTKNIAGKQQKVSTNKAYDVTVGGKKGTATYGDKGQRMIRANIGNAGVNQVKAGKAKVGQSYGATLGGVKGSVKYDAKGNRTFQALQKPAAPAKPPKPAK